jgi:flagellar biosynthesis component FlhA
MKELVVPFALLVTLGSMLVPIPAGILDFLLGVNLCIALTLLISSLYVADALKLSALPTLLLISTIYRLSLNVASTRLILSKGEGGDLIEAFGNIVIGGNLIVGIVIFLVISMIQFVVIAKGSERVAEVAARFTLDALPGKQMSIDADVRAGLIDFETARKRRSEMQTESRFYGALDGAMKFVKGDAIAGIIIAGINLVAGIALGVLVEGLAITTAISKYSLLTIGDGLVSQVPALFSALSAGIVVTRVSKGDGLNVAQELLSQIGQVRAAKFIIATFCSALMFVPSMPVLPFALLTVALLFSAFWHSQQVNAEIDQQAKFEPKRASLLEVRLSKSMAQELFSDKEFKHKINKSREEIFAKTGLLLLVPNFEVEDSIGQGFSINIRGIRAALVSTDVSYQQFSQTLVSLVEERRLEMIDDILSRRLLDFLDKDYPELVASVVPGAVSVTQVTEILRALAKEFVSIRPLELILQGIAESRSKTEGSRAILEDVRVRIGRLIIDPYLNSEGSLSCYVLDTPLDAMISQAERNSQSLPTEEIKNLASELFELNINKPIIICSKAARLLLRECLALRQLEVTVLAHEEIPDDLKIEFKKVVGEYDATQTQEIIARLAA